MTRGLAEKARAMLDCAAFLVGSAVIQSANSGKRNGSGAHLAGFQGDIEIALWQALGSKFLAGRAYNKNLGMRCIAAPVFDNYGEVVAGLSVSGPTSRVSADKIDALATSVKEAAKALTTALGGEVTQPRT